MNKLEVLNILEDYRNLTEKIQNFMQNPFENINFTDTFEEESDEWYELPQTFIVDKYGHHIPYYIFGTEHVNGKNYFAGVDLETDDKYYFEPSELDLGLLIILISILSNYGHIRSTP